MRITEDPRETSAKREGYLSSEAGFSKDCQNYQRSLSWSPTPLKVIARPLTTVAGRQQRGALKGLSVKRGEMCQRAGLDLEGRTVPLINLGLSVLHIPGISPENVD